MVSRSTRGTSNRGNWTLLLATVIIAAVPVRAPADGLDRIVAYHDTILCVNENALAPGVVTYAVRQQDWIRQQILGKLMISLKSGGQVHPFGKVPGAELRIQPWGFELHGAIDNTRIVMDYFPVLHGRNTSHREGAAALRITTEGTRPDDEFVFEYGGVRLGDFVNPVKRTELLSADDFPGSADDRASSHGDFSCLASPDVPLVVGLKGFSNDGQFSLAPNAATHILRGVWKPTGQGRSVCWILIAFAPDQERIQKIEPHDLEAEFQKTKTHFDAMSALAVIDTPVESINEAFRWGLLNLEYCYYKPIGWIESLDHWVTLYSMMYPRAADGLGQFERSRDCLLAHAERVGPTGRVRNLDPTGLVRDDFMWNHHYIWDIEHYLDWTGDVETIRKLYLVARKVVDFVFDTYDRDGNLLIGFDQQIGYQEDQVWTPHDGGSASMAGVEMLRIMGKLATAVGNEEEAVAFAEKEAKARASLRRDLWSSALGCYINYRDPFGKPHWMGQYHTYLWPAIYGFADEFGCYTSARQVVDGLTSPRGLVYVSNNFPAHQAHTTGCQEGAVQSPLAAWGLNAAGLHDEGAAMFEAFADLVMSPKNKGCFPETAVMDGTWFSPTASFYIEAVIEGLFGISRKGTQLIVNPMIPEDWRVASIRLPALSLTINQDDSSRSLELAYTDRQPVTLACRLPPAEEYTVTVNGQQVGPAFSAGIRCVNMVLDLPARNTHKVSVQFSRAEIAVHHPTAVVEGQDFTCRVEGGTALAGINDPQGIVRSLRIANGTLSATVRENVVTPFLKFGELGRKYCSQRTVFLELRCGEHPLYWPVDVTVGGGEASQAAAPVAARHVPLDQGDAEPIEFARPHFSKDWKRFRLFDDLGHMGLLVLEDPLAALGALATHRKPDREGNRSDGRLRIPPEKTGGVPFEILPGKLLVVSDYMNEPSATIGIDKDVCALHFLVLPLLANEDTFSEVAEIIVRCAEPPKAPGVAPTDRRTVHRVLCHPGDLDNWYSPTRSHGYHSVGRGWTRNLAITTDDATLNVITVDLGALVHVDTVTVRTIGRYPAIGLVAITGSRARPVCVDTDESR